MKNTNLILILLFIIILIPTSSTKRLISATEDFSTYVGYSGVLNADVKEEEKKEDEKVACTCNGTKKVKSGDGIVDIPCPCGSSCTCGSNTKTGCQCGCGKAECMCGKGKGACAQLPVAAANEKPIFFTYDFGAKWCYPCQQFLTNEKPKLEKSNWVFVNKEWVKGCSVVIVDIDEQKELYHKIINEFKEYQKTLPKEKQVVINDSIPCYIVMKNNKPIAMHEGMLPYDKFAEFSNSNIEANR